MSESVIIDGHPRFIRPSQVKEAIEQNKAAQDIARLAQDMSHDFLRELAPRDPFYYPNILEIPSIPRIVGAAAGGTRVIWDVIDDTRRRAVMESLAIFVAAATVARTDELRGRKHGLMKKTIELADGTVVSPHRFLCIQVLPNYLTDLSILMGTGTDNEVNSKSIMLQERHLQSWGIT